MYAIPSAAKSIDFSVHSRRRYRSPWPLRAAKAAAVLLAIGTLSLGLAKVAEGGAAGPYEALTVEPGDTLWSIAADRYPGGDVRAKVFQIEAANHLNGPAIRAGETLQVPTR